MAIKQRNAVPALGKTSLHCTPSPVFHGEGRRPGRNAAAKRVALLLVVMVSSCLLGGWRGAAATVIWTNASGGSWLVPQN
jgi:hypothetical protein